MKVNNMKRFWKTVNIIKISNDKKASEDLPKRLIKSDGILTII